MQFVGYALCVLLTYSSSFKLWHTSINIHWVMDRNQLPIISRPYTRYTDTIAQLDSLLLQHSKEHTKWVTGCTIVV